MVLRSTASWLFGLIFAATGTSEQPGPAQPSGFYSGAEWVLDAHGNGLGSSAILVQRALDVSHRSLDLRVLRESPNTRGRLSSECAENLTLVATSMNPYSLEGRGRREGGLHVTHFEELKGDVLVTRDEVRDAEGHVLEVHILNATPLSKDEFFARSGRVPLTSAR